MTIDRTNRPATIDDVAKSAGVSRSAVSKVLRDAYGVSDSMRERVTAAIVALDYRPNLAARAMRGKSYTLGIELPQLNNAFLFKVVAGVQGALSDTGYQLIIAPAEAGPREGYKALEALVDRQVDGVIAISPPVSKVTLERIAHSIPLVLFGRHLPSDAYDTVTGDDSAGGIEVMKHLVDLGHKRIVHLTRDAPVTQLGAPHRLRLDAYEAAMEKAGHAEFAEVWRSAEGQDAAYHLTLEMLASCTHPTAIFAAHDELALGALWAVRELGLPIAVVGYDNVPMAAFPGIALTSFDQPGAEMGAKAVELLLDRLHGREESRNEMFSGELRVRSSTTNPGQR